MKAIRVHEFGGPEVMRYEEVPDPQPPGPGQVLVRLHAIGVNPVETYVRSGQYAALPELPYIPGSDGAGDVVAVGDGVSRLEPGQRVYIAGVPSYCELTVAPQDQVWALPDHLSYEQGAAIGIPYLTAYRAIHYVGKAQPGDWALVHGASGGVGTAAMQLGAAYGLHMVGTAGTEAGLEHVRSLGVGPALRHDELQQAVALTGGRGFDLVLEMAAHLSLGQVLPCLAYGGRVVVIGSRGPVEINPRDLMPRDAAIMGMTYRRGGPEQVRRMNEGIAPLLAAGQIKPVIGRTFPLAEAAAAHRAVLEPGALGKMVLLV